MITELLRDMCGLLYVDVLQNALEFVLECAIITYTMCSFSLRIKKVFFGN